VPSHILNDPKHWHQRAEEARCLAEQMNDSQSRQMMIRIAADYDQLAKHAQQRVRARGSVRHPCEPT
jgi:hypothetical protein